MCNTPCCMCGDFDECEIRKNSYLSLLLEQKDCRACPDLFAEHKKNKVNCLENLSDEAKLIMQV